MREWERKEKDKLWIDEFQIRYFPVSSYNILMVNIFLFSFVWIGIMKSWMENFNSFSAWSRTIVKLSDEDNDDDDDDDDINVLGICYWLYFFPSK